MSNHRNDGRPRGKKRLIYFGPGIVIALILAVILGGNTVKQNMAQRHAPSGPPIVERHLVTSSVEQLGPTPEIDFILVRRETLGLTNEQMAKLNKLQSEWKYYYEPKMAEANAAARQLQGNLARTRGNGSIPTAQIQKDAGPMIAISAEISAKRREYWGRAMQVLSPEQRETVATERKARQTAGQ